MFMKKSQIDNNQAVSLATHLSPSPCTGNDYYAFCYRENVVDT